MKGICGLSKIFFFLVTGCLYCFVMSVVGEATEEELFSRLRQIKDGPEQQNNTSSTEREEDPVGMFALIVLFYLTFFREWGGGS